eukprot:GHVS01013260.1.p1 GENE.GHVS01013260.1~~GHVS01013260.1.p1  ORF type:complete len:773 (-),score=155.01 GHVS01013260.1:202-2520(-)
MVSPSGRVVAILSACGISGELRDVVLALSAEDGVMSVLRQEGDRPQRVEELKELVDRALQHLQDKLQTEMRSCHNLLLDRVSTVPAVEEHLGDIRRHVDKVSQLAHRLSKEGLEPCATIRKNLDYLRRLDELQDAVRISLQHLSLVKRLRELASATPQELTKMAQTLVEVEDMAADERTQQILTSLEFLQEDVRFVAETGEQLRTVASQKLKTGLRQQNVFFVGESLQVYRQLRNLDGPMDAAIEELVDETVETFGGQQATGGSSFLQELTRFLSRLEAGVKQTALVQQVLDGLLDEDEEDERVHRCTQDSFTSRYWCATVLAFKNKVKPVLSSRRDQLVVECPRIKQQLQITFNNIAEQHVTIDFVQERMFQDIFNDLVDAYIDSSLHALTDPVHLMFPLGGGDGVITSGRVVMLPTPADIRAYVSIVTAQLSQVEAVPDMANKVSQNVCNSILLLSHFIESLVDTQALHLPLVNNDCRTVLNSIPAASTAHQRNARLHGLAFALHTALSPCCCMQGKTEETGDSLAKALEQLKATTAQIMRSWLRDLQEALGEICMDEMFNTDDPKKYINDIKQVCTSVLQQYLCYVPSANIASNLKTTCAYILHSFVCHACMLGPLRESLILSLAADMAELEVALTSLLGQMHHLLKPDFVFFHSFRRLLFLDGTALTQPDDVAVALVPPLLVATHVALSRLSVEPSAFIQRTGLTAQQLSHVLLAATIQSQAKAPPLTPSELSGHLLDYTNSLHHISDPLLLPLLPFVRAILEQPTSQ